MDIPSTIETVSTQPITADALSIDKMTVDGSARDRGPWSATVVACPYVKGDPTAIPPVANVYASDTRNYQTADLMTAAANMAAAGFTALGTALQLIVYQALAEWHLFCEARRPALDAAVAALATAQAALDAAATAEAAALVKWQTTTYTALQQARQGGRPDAIASALQAYQQAGAVYQEAQAATTAAKTAVDAAQVRVSIAQAAVDDPANPPLEAQT